MNCGCQNAYCEHAWDAVKDVDFSVECWRKTVPTRCVHFTNPILPTDTVKLELVPEGLLDLPDSWIYSFVNEGIAALKTEISNDVWMQGLPNWAIQFPQIGYEYWLQEPGMMPARAILTASDTTRRHFYWKTPMGALFVTGKETQIQDNGNWYYPWGAPRKDEPETWE